jgi:DNA-directed RNA polymerase specialized sigma24 family protein
LRRRGAPSATIEDALQTAALRAFRRRGRFDSLDGFVQWTIVVAWHEVQAEWRHQARVELGNVPECPHGVDPATVIESRVALDAVAVGVSELTDAERQAISSALADEPSSDGPMKARTKMRRYRARQHLAEIVDRQW